MWRLWCFVLGCYLCCGVAQAGEPSRQWGVGTAIGGGFSYNVIPSVAPLQPRWGPQADLLTLELRLFLAGGSSLDLYSQLGNTLISGILASTPKGPQEEGVLYFISLGMLYNFNVPIGKGKHHARHLLVGLGPELGMDIGVGGVFERTRPVKIHVRLATRIGVEWLFRGRSLGLQLMLRGFFEPLSYAGLDGQSILTMGTGALLEVALVYYRTTTR